jgi:hypothetical protein
MPGRQQVGEMSVGAGHFEGQVATQRTGPTVQDAQGVGLQAPGADQCGLYHHPARASAACRQST